MARILVTDDNVDVLNLLAHQLRRRGHDVVAVETPQDALRLVGAGLRPDVAVLDVMMPHMSGFKLLKALRAHEGLDELPIVFVSARVQHEDVAAGRALGATYLTKPFRVAELTAAVEEALAPPADTPGSLSDRRSAAATAYGEQGRERGDERAGGQQPAGPAGTG